MSAFNQVTLCGNLTRDWELRYLPSGAAVGNNSIAINRKWKDDEGEEKEEVTFVELVLFGKQAENAAEYQRKGDPALIGGRLRQETWEDKESGDKRSNLKVVVERLVFIGGNGKQKPRDEEQDDKPRKRKADTEDEEDRPRKKRKHDYSQDEGDGERPF